MKLYTVSDPNGDWVGSEKNGGLVDLTGAGVAASMLALIADGARSHAEAVKATAARPPRMALKDAKLRAPIPRPGKVLCSGINYRGHAEENPNAKLPTEPFFFAKLQSSVVGHEARIVHPRQTQRLDYEVEFSAVIGKRLSHAAEADVMPAIFGYTLVHDVSARDVQMEDNQITLAKNFNGFAPIGPCILTADAMPRPDNVRLLTRLNGVTKQDGSTSDWLFSLPRLIAFLSGFMALEPGDIVTTGTPAGVGLFRKPPLFMQPGDVVEIEAEGIGVLRNFIVAEGQ